jgi:hypothetical protein
MIKFLSLQEDIAKKLFQDEAKLFFIEKQSINIVSK